VLRERSQAQGSFLITGEANEYSSAVCIDQIILYTLPRLQLTDNLDYRKELPSRDVLQALQAGETDPAPVAIGRGGGVSIKSHRRSAILTTRVRIVDKAGDTTRLPIAYRFRGPEISAELFVSLHLVGVSGAPMHAADSSLRYHPIDIRLA